MTVEGHTDDTDGTDFLWLAEDKKRKKNIPIVLGFEINS